MKMKALNVRQKYTLGGILFGLSFPIFSQIIDCMLNDLSFTISSIILIHQKNVIHYVVDTAPLVLGGAGFLLGHSHQKKNDINTELRKINESLDTLAYKITHDLRGPAINIKSLTDILLLPSDAKDEDKKDEIISKINEAMSMWLVTFDDFMSLLKHEKTGHIEQQVCSLEQVTEELMSVLSLDIEQSSAIIKSDFSKCPEVFVTEIYLESILKNLITNAIKYAHPDRVPEIQITSELDQNDMVRIMVKDNGTGIDLEKYGNKLFGLFERFGEEPNVPGSGIGLYLVKEQVEKNNGTITVDSIPNQGSTFTVSLPRYSNKL